MEIPQKYTEVRNSNVLKIIHTVFSDFSPNFYLCFMLVNHSSYKTARNKECQHILTIENIKERLSIDIDN